MIFWWMSLCEATTNRIVSQVPPVPVQLCLVAKCTMQNRNVHIRYGTGVLRYLWYWSTTVEKEYQSTLDWRWFILTNFRDNVFVLKNTNVWQNVPETEIHFVVYRLYRCCYYGYMTKYTIQMHMSFKTYTYLAIRRWLINTKWPWWCIV